MQRESEDGRPISPVESNSDQNPAQETSYGDSPVAGSAMNIACYHGLHSLRIPTAEDLGVDTRGDLEELRTIARCMQPAEQDVKYWDGAPQPWRNGTDDSPITDPAVIAREEKRKCAAEAEDVAASATPDEQADRLHGFGVQLGFLLFLTFELNLWSQKTWEVVQFLVKPATEQSKRRCRFAELPFVRQFTGPATVFASHCWHCKWGDLVAAVCAGADTRRVVWIDIFAVRQWPGNGADLDFRGVIARCHATIVAVAPVEGTLTAGMMENTTGITTFLESDEYQKAAKVLAFCRLWCLVEIFATIESSKGLIFRGAAVASVDRSQRLVFLSDSEEREAGEWNDKGKMSCMLSNCSNIVSLERAECAVAADRDREMATIEVSTADKGGFTYVNGVVKASIVTATIVMQSGVAAVDNFLCGEKELLQMLPNEKVYAAVLVACAAGQVEVLVELLLRGCEQDGADLTSVLRDRGFESTKPYKRMLRRVMHSAGLGEFIQPLHDRGIKTLDDLLVSKGDVSWKTLESVGMSKEQVTMFYPQALELLENDGWQSDFWLSQARRVVVQEFLPLGVAARNGRTGVVKLLLQVEGVDVNRRPNDSGTFGVLAGACADGHEAVVRLLLAHNATDVNHARTSDGATPLLAACLYGHEAVVRLLLAHSATDVNKARTDNGATPLITACEYGHEAVVRLLLSHAATDVSQGRSLIWIRLGLGSLPMPRPLRHLLLYLLRHVERRVSSTPLSKACQNRYESIAHLLLEHKSIETANLGGLLSLTFAALIHRDASISAALLKHRPLIALIVALVAYYALGLPIL